ncbi:OmpA family protein [Egicoccus sp. AB-alg2]|uniref:OmpA family protein n=1 Tax=Egicoccus sp. AB-alg2 TaxID=3242693 RepID=UPI00359DE1BC
MPAQGTEVAWWERPGWPVPVPVDDTGTAEDAPAGVEPCQFSVPDDVLFEVGSAELSVAAVDLLAPTAVEIAATSGPVVVRGNTDSTGPEELHVPLSSGRARGVAQVLVGHGVDESRIVIEAAGASRPRADESGPDPDQARALNRRTEIELFCTQLATP